MVILIKYEQAALGIALLIGGSFCSLILCSALCTIGNIEENLGYMHKNVCNLLKNSNETKENK